MVKTGSCWLSDELLVRYWNKDCQLLVPAVFHLDLFFKKIFIPTFYQPKSTSELIDVNISPNATCKGCRFLWWGIETGFWCVGFRFFLPSTLCLLVASQELNFESDTGTVAVQN